ncbi:hypothetical protein FEM48_Zijuj07G0058000 [Ziziphus jujuba var. spinosa]|uniref:Protein NO VEIN C-terminal domain-containing protein n=1 Tax=Ziziphus jujuba var. spinosa TaxID=714518 RepID=A0A978V2U1_ZIZJJ|nr:hypothetical protein FEM48_Zijuj07G0058000 [Ziziphus jujuba var. spinosa]
MPQRFQAPNPTNNMPQRFQAPSPNNMPPFQPANPNVVYTQPQQQYQNQNGGFPLQQFPSPGFHQPQPSQNLRELIEMVDRAVVKARRDLLAAGESVTAWKVSQSALLMLQIDNWGSLGFQMQQVPSLRSLIHIEAKINAFINCFVAVRRITSLYDLEVAICDNEAIGQFEELELGPFLRHPLVQHYFSVNLDTTEVFKITSEEIIALLNRFMYSSKNKDIKVDEFLDFICKKRSVSGKEKLGIRIQSLGMHISAISKARNSESAVLKKHQGTSEPKFDKKCRKRPLSPSQKKLLDERFNAISERVENFSHVNKNFCGKHIKFDSTSSEDEQTDDCKYDDDNDSVSGGHMDFSSQSIKSSEQISSCPYPSATEEMKRLGLKGESCSGLSPASAIQRNYQDGVPAKKQRKYDNPNVIEKSVLPSENSPKTKKFNHMADFSMANDSLGSFISTWKEVCIGHTVTEVFEKMLHFIIQNQLGRKFRITNALRKKIKFIFSSYPFIGLLNVAVSSIKRGMWDSIYDTFQTISQNNLTKTFDGDPESERITVEPSLKNTVEIAEHLDEHPHSVSVEDIISKIATYPELDHDIQNNKKSRMEKLFILFRNLYNCEHWLMEQFSVKEFRSLGYGNFPLFLEKYLSLLPRGLWNFLIGDIGEKPPLEVCMMNHQLVVLVSQASNNLWENGKITKQNISLLLMRQFPFISFEVTENGSLEDFSSIVLKNKNNVISKSVVFSVTLHGTSDAVDSLAQYENDLVESASVGLHGGQIARIPVASTSKDAVKVLLKAPMLSDLNLWSHWDLLFAPSLGPLVPWLLNEVTTDALLCLVTRDGKVIRIDHSATVESFLEAAIKGCPFQTAVQLLSLFSVVGGEKHVPESLLKCHAQYAFKVILKNSLDGIDLNDSANPVLHGKMSCTEEISKVGIGNFGSDLDNNLSKTDIAVASISRFVLDSLKYLPAEFCGFAADIFLFGMRSIIKDAASAILCECSKTERLMLHEIGLSHGVMEWIDDYHAFCSNDATDMVMPTGSCLTAARSEIQLDSRCNQDTSDKSFTSESGIGGSVGDDGHNGQCTKVSSVISGADARIGRDTKHLSEIGEREDAALVIESIRRDEFGLDPSLPEAESSMVRKQHARLGRALHCLSQELYSQDSHFLLELVQNADDNVYPENVEPTLTFILQDSSIIVLNNERGFSAHNIRALCDVGNSTKKGSNAGYIGQKGIGFKSVFRVTDAPEIHSNGFHVKFDITEGQIGFILPTIIPSCDIGLFSRLAYSGDDQLECNSWNTCIVLPFRSRLKEGTAMKNIISMFSDLHPSLLLFLHRLQCIKFRNLPEDSFTVMRKEIVGDGIVKVSHGNDKMTWFVVSQKLQADFIRRDVQMTEISIAFTLLELENGGYSPHLVQQPVFAFLPLRTYGLKFILQGDFVLPSSREEVDGDSPWNQWLLSEFPGLFVKAERSFCALPYFRENPGRAVAAYMSFVPLVGEAHGFFSVLPRLIISKLRVSNCLLWEGYHNEWVPPCKVVRGWNEQARYLLPDGLLREHLGLGFLDKNIVLSDALAMALGIEEYGPKILLRVMSSLCHTENGLKSMGLGWLSSCLIALYSMLVDSSDRASLGPGVELEFINDLRRIPCIPLSDGRYGTVNEGTIWLHFDALSTGFEGDHGLESFPNLYAKLRIVSPALLTASSPDGSHVDLTMVDKLNRMLYKVGIERLSAHEIIKVHILPAISAERIEDGDENLMIEYVCFVMYHLQSNCSDCHVERESIISELRNKAYILTNNGFKRPAEVSIHFSKEFGNPINIEKLTGFLDINWNEVSISYLKHPINKSLQYGLTNWREFFEGIGIADFVKVAQVEKNIADVLTLFKNLMTEGDLISPGSIAKDWESSELVDLMSIVSREGNNKCCAYLLEVLDTLWDSSFSDKATGYCTSKSAGVSKSFKSSFMSSISDVKWVLSSMDSELHYPKDLYHDCDAVRSILGSSAPYAVPKVRSEKLVSDIGFKTKVTLEDVLEIIKLWRRCETPFKASIMQMSKLYAFIWNEMTTLKKDLAEEFCSGPFIFIPFFSGSKHGDVVSGMFLSPNEVHWKDSTGAMDQMKNINCQHLSADLSRPLNKTLYSFYPNLHDFFVVGCGVHESPPLRSYLQILQQLSSVKLPSQAATSVFKVFLQWTEGLKSGLSPEDVVYLKESLKQIECTVLPTVQDKWVSVHPSFGLVCWCDDRKLKKKFKHVDGIDFVYFGELSKDDKETVKTKVSVLMKTLGIPALSEVVSREAIYYGLADSNLKASLVNWALPYAQRYLYSIHPDKYSQLKQCGFSAPNTLQVVAVEKLFYRDVIKSCGGASDKRIESTCLLQGNILYTTEESDAHTLFMELSRMFFDGVPELHLANFLHMITTMAESGSTEDQTEIFILKTQKIPKLPDEESIWSLKSVSSIPETDELLQTNVVLTNANEQSTSKSKRRAGIHSSWPPADWKTAPGFAYARANGFRTNASVATPSGSSLKKDEDDCQGIFRNDSITPTSIDNDWTFEDDSPTTSTALILSDSNNLEHCGYVYKEADLHSELDPTDSNPISEHPESCSSTFSKRDLCFGTPNPVQAMLTGRLGEHLAFKYFTGKLSNSYVNWVNKENETGLPYDIIIEDQENQENGKEFIEVKSTKSPRKDWFLISSREWQFAMEKGDAFSIAHVVILGNNTARVSVFKNPANLCRLGRLQLVVMMPKQGNEFSVVS